MRVVVIGGGVAGLGAAHRAMTDGHDVIVLEGSARVGGLVESERLDEGVLLEHGADALLADKVGGADTLHALGLGGAVARHGEAPRQAFVHREGRLVPMPAGLFTFERKALGTMLQTPLLPLRAKLRLLVEPLVPRGATPDESVEAFFARRLGADVERELVAPMLRGLYGAPTSTLGVRAVFPKLAGMEDRFGSVGLALLFAERAPRGRGLVALRDGMESIPRAFAAQLGERVQRGARVRELERRAHGWRITMHDGARLEADAVVVATDVSTAARLLAPVAPSLSDELASIGSTDAEVVSLGFARSDVEHPLDGTGFVEGGARNQTLACTFASAKWEGRAPSSMAVFRTVLRGQPALADRDLVTLAHEELQPILGLRGRPRFVRTRRRHRALPVYGVGHAQLAARLRAAAHALGPLALAGNYLDGVGVPDAITSGRRAIEALAP